MNRMRRHVCALLGLGALATLGASAQVERPSDFGGIKAVTRPSRDAIMGFTFATEVREVAVRGGDVVRKGDLLIRARDAEAQALVRLQSHRALNDYRVKAAENDLRLAELEFERVSKAHETDVAGDQEYERSKTALESARINLGIATEDLEEQRLQLDRLTTDLERFRLDAPFDGIVDSVTAEVGLSTRDGEKIIRVVNIDPMWIDVATPTDETLRLALTPGSPAWVLLPSKSGGDDPTVSPAKVVEVSPVADSASATRRIRVEVANPDALPAGLACHVRFTNPDARREASVEPRR